jgi:hypothetical protein
MLETVTAQDVPAFMGVIEGLARKHAWKEALRACVMAGGGLDWSEARALMVPSDGTCDVVALIKGWNHFLPGVEVQALLLLDGDGRLLDLLECEISSQLTHMSTGTMHVVLKETPTPERTQFIIRLDGTSTRGNFSHCIRHRGRSYNYYWGHDLPHNDQPTVWDKNGLCTVGVRAHRFQVIFPSPDGRAKY